MAIYDIIKYEGDNTTFIWKHPCEDFNTLTQLIVHQSQEALFFRDGQALDLFVPGRHTLSTSNIPILRRFVSLPSGGKTPFHAEVYYINKTEQMAIKWGTDNRVQFMEPTYKFPLEIGASGEMSLRVEDSRKLVVKLVGTEISLDQQGLTRYFKAFLMTKVKSYLANEIMDKAWNIFEIDRYLDQMSGDIRQRLVEDFKEYGIALERFMVTTIAKPEDDPNYRKFKNLHASATMDVWEANIRQKVGLIDQTTEAQKMVIEAQGLAQKRTTEGYTYQDERGYDVAEKLAANEGVGTMSSTGVGFGIMAGMGAGVGAHVGGFVTNALNSISSPAAPGGATPGSPMSGGPVAGDGQPPMINLKQEPAQESPRQDVACAQCGAALAPDKKFCADCGAPVAAKSVCANCAAELLPGKKFCADCGAPVNP